MAQDFTIEKFVVRAAAKTVAALLLLAALAYPVDFAVWRIRMAASRDGHGATGTVEVKRVIAAELKGSKEEYYFDGTETVACSRSLYPQGGMLPCWWQVRHRDKVVRY